MSQEDKLAKAELEQHDECKLEVSYNNYGTRGVVDFVGVNHTDQGRTVTAMEFKSESAVLNATGANEIIRQFNRQVENFDSHPDFGSYSDDIVHLLVFYPTQAVVDHVRDNLGLYQTVRSQYKNANVLLKHPEAKAPLVITNGRIACQVGAEPAIDESDIDGSEVLHYE